METFSAVIGRWPSLAAFAADNGFTTRNAQKMKERDVIPPKHWPRVVAAAKRRGYRGVTYDRLAALQNGGVQ